MGLFDWLFGGKPGRVAEAERVWLTGENRAAGVVKELASHVEGGRSVLLLAHFPSTLASLAPELIENGLPHESVPVELTPPSALRLAAGPPRVLFGLVRNLRVPEFPAGDDEPESPLPVVLAERHFLREHDERVIQFAGGLGGRAAVSVHVSLDDELLKQFAGEWVVNTLRGLGMQPDESLDSAMVSRNIRRAQEKMRGSLKADELPADSPAEWLERNGRAG